MDSDIEGILEILWERDGDAQKNSSVVVGIFQVYVVRRER